MEDKREFEQRLAEMVRLYWRARSHIVQVSLEAESISGKRGVVLGVRSNLVGGLPQNWRGRNDDLR